jgi:hypothetical protein
MAFWKNYSNLFKRLPKNWGVWLFVLIILTGGHSPIGKVIAIVFLVLAVPIFQMVFNFEPRTSGKNR